MFDLPEAKRIRRSDLHTRSSTSPSPTRSEPDPELQSQLASHFASLYGDFSLSPPKPIFCSESPNRIHPEEAELEDEEQAYEFRLFSAPLTSTSTTGTATQKIILANESEDTGTGGFVHARRPKSYYFHTPSSGALKAQFEAAAVSGETVLQWREKRAWALEVPWRVITLKVTPSKSKSKAQAPDDGSMGGIDAVTGIEVSGTEDRKKKLGKKRRILLREKKRKRDAAEEARRKVAEERKEAEREKRTRRNREKKVKRKMKEKAKKIGGGEENGVSVDGSVGVPHGDEAMGGVSD